MHRTNRIFEQMPPPSFCLQVVCKNIGVFLGAYGMCFHLCNRISMKLAFLPLLPCLETEMCHDSIHIHLEPGPATFLEEH